MACYLLVKPATPACNESSPNDLDDIPSAACRSIREQPSTSPYWLGQSARVSFETMPQRLIISDNPEDPGNPLVLDGEAIDAAAKDPVGIGKV